MNRRRARRLRRREKARCAASGVLLEDVEYITKRIDVAWSGTFGTPHEAALPLSHEELVRISSGLTDVLREQRRMFLPAPMILPIRLRNGSTIRLAGLDFQIPPINACPICRFSPCRCLPRDLP